MSASIPATSISRSDPADTQGYRILPADSCGIKVRILIARSVPDFRFIEDDQVKVTQNPPMIRSGSHNRPGRDQTGHDLEAGGNSSRMPSSTGR